MTSSSDPVWFITGCSTGFGHEIARDVLGRGWRAVVTARDPSAVADLVALAPDRALAVALDVTKSEQIRNAVREATDRFGSIDVLVNNAGYGYLAAVEEGEDDEIRAMFDANFFGLAEVTRAVLPIMREQGHGHVINITSIGGHVGNPGSGYYAATKFAVEGLSEALSKEGAPLGIKVTAVAPGPFRTDWAGRSLKQTGQPIAAYHATAGARRQQISSISGRQPGDPVRAAKAIVDITLVAEPPLHLVLGKPGLAMVRDKNRALAAEMEAWESTTLGADYPEN